MASVSAVIGRGHEVARVPLAGSAAPLGVSLIDGGMNVSVYSKHASRIDLLLFDGRDAAGPSEIIG